MGRNISKTIYLLHEEIKTLLHSVEGVDADLRPRGKKQVKCKAVLSSPMKLASVEFGRNDPISVLKAGLRTVRHHTAGWLKDDLMAEGKLEDTKEAIYAKMFADYQAQQIYIRAQKDILGDDFDPLHVEIEEWKAFA